MDASRSSGSQRLSSLCDMIASQRVRLQSPGCRAYGRWPTACATILSGGFGAPAELRPRASAPHWVGGALSTRDARWEKTTPTRKDRVLVSHRGANGTRCRGGRHPGKRAIPGALPPRSSVAAAVDRYLLGAALHDWHVDMVRVDDPLVGTEVVDCGAVLIAVQGPRISVKVIRRRTSPGASVDGR